MGAAVTYAISRGCDIEGLGRQVPGRWRCGVRLVHVGRFCHCPLPPGETTQYAAGVGGSGKAAGVSERIGQGDVAAAKVNVVE